MSFMPLRHTKKNLNRLHGGFFVSNFEMSMLDSNKKECSSFNGITFDCVTAIAITNLIVQKEQKYATT